jgi:hypothetical protein
MRKNKALLILLLLVTSLYTKAQNIQTQQDFGIWIGVKLEKKLPAGFELSLEQQLRTWKNSTKIGSSVSELGVNYTINKLFKLNGGFRYIYDTNRFRSPQSNFRYNLGIQLKLKISKKFTFYYKAQYQQKFIHDYKTTTPTRVSAVRHKIKLQMKYKKIHKFYFSTESFIESDITTTPYFKKQRFNLGDKIKTKAGVFDTGIGYEVNLQSNYFTSFFFLKLIYIISL